ncbi:hypothetical protein AB4Z50_25935 [Paenibacillus sp. 2TAB26]|uniref:hypothetical protein n=1 Tax=Paenibacillus sp. 2TAB26 TaxID=3233005 RepID=UPI003F98EFDE
MKEAMGTILLIAAMFVLIGLTIFADDGTFGDAKVQRDRSHTISNSTTVPTVLK